MLGFLLGLFRLVGLLSKGHRGLVLENLALRQQLAIYKREQRHPRLIGSGTVASGEIVAIPRVVPAVQQ